MKILSVHAHFDDFEFTAAGLFAAWKEKLGDALQARVIVSTDGRAGHHFRSPSEISAMRHKEQEASARVGGYEFRPLLLPNGTRPREACLLLSTDLLAALWKAIREFEPDYLFCPPVPEDPLAGIHIDHVTVAEAVRRVAYMINVPHAFLEEYPSSDPAPRSCKVPVIVNVYDSYTRGANTHDIAVDVEKQFPAVCAMSWCHQSQVTEWLPWVGRHDQGVPADLQDWQKIMRQRFDRKNQELGLATRHALEVFTITAWGVVPTVEQVLADFPQVD
ncbi:MAG TPA: PIG-L family deacetylase, partial [bacterium]|nr:PIG-L family deacetylase [bacterium]